MPFYHGVEVVEKLNGERPIPQARSGVIGIVGTAPNAAVSVESNKPLLINTRESAALLGATGTLPDAIELIYDQGASLVIVIVAEEGDTDGETLSNVIAACEHLRDCQSVLGYTPDILIAPGFTHQRTGTKNAVAAKLESVAPKLPAIVVLDAPNTDNAAAQLYADDFSTGRTFVADPFVLKSKDGVVTPMPASSAVAGVIARTDNEEGFWVSPSNKPVYNIVGTARPIDFKMGDNTTTANLLNEQNVATIIRLEGYRLWGNRTTSSDIRYTFLSVRRTADAVAKSIENGLLWAIDRGITKTLVEDVVQSVNDFLANLKTQGAIINGQAWADPAKNTPSQIAQGMLKISFDFAPVYPAERITIDVSINNGYLDEIVTIG
jgi:uncharacterized protein